MQLHIAILPIQHIICRISVTEPICKNLIKNGTFRPVWRLELRIEIEVIIILHTVHHTAFIVHSCPFAFVSFRSGNRKIIIRAALRIMKHHFIIIKPTFRKTFMHICFHAVRHNRYQFCIILRRPKAQPDTVTGAVRCI